MRAISSSTFLLDTIIEIGQLVDHDDDHRQRVERLRFSGRQRKRIRDELAFGARVAIFWL